MTAEPYIIDLDPETDTKLKIYLFKDVENVNEIHNNIIKGQWNCTVIKPSLILNPFHVVAAANKAVVSAIQNSMTTKTVFTEILFNLSLTKSITQSIKKFGIESDLNLLVCFLVNKRDYSIDVIPQIKGKMCSINQLREFRNMNEIKSVYKVDSDCEDELIDIIVSRMATKNFVSH